MIEPRESWGAPASRSHLPPLPLPSEGLVGHYNGPKVRVARSDPHDRCREFLRGTRRFHTQVRGWLDIAYSFAVCHHGRALELRGWDKRTAAQGTNDGNNRWHAVFFLVGEDQEPSDGMYTAFAELARLHERRYGDVRVRYHGAFKNTECPGPHVRKWILEGGWKTIGEDVVTEQDKRDIADMLVDRLLDQRVQAVRPWKPGGEKRSLPIRYLLADLWTRTVVNNRANRGQDKDLDAVLERLDDAAGVDVTVNVDGVDPDDIEVEGAAVPPDG